MKNASLDDMLMEATHELFGWSKSDFEERYAISRSDDHTNYPRVPRLAIELLQTKWTKNRDVEALYSHPEYFMIPVVDSAFAGIETARQACRMIPNDFAGTVLDFGAGPGFTTLAIARRFPKAQVWWYDTNVQLRKLFHWFVAQTNLTNVRDGTTDPWPDVGFDLVQAIEVVEHLQAKDEHDVGDPLTEFQELLRGATWLVHSTNWTSEDRWPTIGHFSNYRIDGKLVPTSKAGKAFAEALKRRGWIKYGSGYNRRPNLWRKMT